MEKIVVLSTNNNPDYFHYSAYQRKAWNKFGWKVCIMTTSDVVEILPCDYQIILPEIDVRKETLAQAGRLYAANQLPSDAMIMTCDMDLIPLSDYWHPKEDEITIYGHDLTWFSYFPMGYVAMTGEKWKEKFFLTGDTYMDMLRDFKKYSDMVYSDDWNVYWNYDWQFLTDTLMPFKPQLTFVNRGQIDIAGATLAKGRIDRYNWQATQNQPEPFIDMHCENNNTRHPAKLEPFLEVYERFHGKV